MMRLVGRVLWVLGYPILKLLERRIQRWVKPVNRSLVWGAVTDLTRGKTELMLENAFLRQQVIVLSRAKKQPPLTNQDRRILVLLARCLPFWKVALLIVQPDTLIRWHRELFKFIWRRKSNKNGKPQPATFVRNHAADIWACDFVQTYDVFFRAIFVFVIIELGWRKVIYIPVTRSPSDAWVAQQLREATPFGQYPKYLIRDNDRKYGEHFVKVAAEIEILRTSVRAPRANAYCERFIGSLRRECLDHSIILSNQQLHRLVKNYVQYFISDRPHQGINQQIPSASTVPPSLHVQFWVGCITPTVARLPDCEISS